MTLIAIEEHWIMPELTSALQLPCPSPTRASPSTRWATTRQRLEDLGAGRIATMDAQGIDVSILALTPPGTQPLPADGRRASEPRRERRCGGDSRRQPVSIPIVVDAAHVVTTRCRRRARTSGGHRPRRHHGLRPIG